MRHYSTLIILGFLLGWLSFLQAQTPSPAYFRSRSRLDANSLAAHRQLLHKAGQGRIDVYFEGDSIVRRWGALDRPELLENWRKNFTGWNAADFGWGGDTLQNILWRLEGGELDGVHPKIIVLLAGTNNVGDLLLPDPKGKKEDIPAGTKAILDLLQQKAPEAVILLTALFPRNDNMAAMPIIDSVNRDLSRLADGKRIRFININARLADPDGKLLEGMMGPDKLHPGLKAYQVWADALKPIFREILGPPERKDLAPPPTGDPAAFKDPK